MGRGDSNTLCAHYNKDLWVKPVLSHRSNIYHCHNTGDVTLKPKTNS